MRGSALAAGYDLAAAYDCVVPARGKALVKTDLAVKVPDDCYGRIGAPARPSAAVLTVRTPHTPRLIVSLAASAAFHWVHHPTRSSPDRPAATMCVTPW